MTVIKQGIKSRLARLEISASATHWSDRQAAHHLKTCRAIVEICGAIRERLLQVGMDPALAVSLQRGEKAAAELAAIPDSEPLRAADAAVTCGDQSDDGASSGLVAQIECIAARFCDGSQPDLTNASLTELFAFCLAVETLPCGD